MAAEEMQFPRRWSQATISLNLGVIWEMSADTNLSPLLAQGVRVVTKSKKKLGIVFLYMSKEFASNLPYRFDLRTGKNLPRMNTWGAAIMREQSRRGHFSTYLRIERPHFLEWYFGDKKDAIFDVEENFRVMYSTNHESVREYLQSVDAIIIRNDFKKYGDIFSAFRWGTKSCVLILASPRLSSLHFQPQCGRLKVLVNSEQELSFYRSQGITAEIFQKPALRVFYERPERQMPKVYDVTCVMWDTAVTRKRFDLVLDALVHLNEQTQDRIRLAVAGDSSAHSKKIQRMNASLRNVETVEVGKLKTAPLRDLFHQSKLSVVASREDANPQVIVQSLACNVPVACAGDITGGSFQITPETGELFSPTPLELSRTIMRMLAGLDRYEPRRHAITIDQSADQIERIIGADPSSCRDR